MRSPTWNVGDDKEMDSNLWQKLARMARKGDRVVVVEGGEGFVLLPLDEYERLSNGEASLQHIADESPISEYPNIPVSSEISSTDENIEDELPPIPELFEDDDENAPTVSSVAPTTKKDDLEEEERFYLEPIE